MNSPSSSPAERLNRIIKEGLCIGCGLCQSTAGPDKIHIVTTPEGALRPLALDALDHAAVDVIYDVCPGTRVEGLPENLIDSGTRADPLWGPYHAIVHAWAADPETRFKAAAGGVLTALAQYMLNTGAADFIHHATHSKTHPSFGEAHISRTAAEALAGARSVYGPTAVLSSIEDTLAQGQRFAFAGTPCDINALRNLAHRDARVDELCVMMMTPVCGGFMQTPNLKAALKTLGAPPWDEITRIQYRGDGCPGPTRVASKDGREMRFSYMDFWADEGAWGLPFRCKICPDGIGEAADIAAADAWPGGSPDPATMESDPGVNAVLARSARGWALMQNAARDGALVIERDASIAEMNDYQPHQVRRKRAVWARHEGLRREGRLAPETARLRIAELAAANPPGLNDAETAGTVRRVREGKADEPAPRAETGTGGV
ncbi:MAG: Coenzyme F420 hydrogenase/dehydrogenase, beta subunit C-terminal domain [Rhodospirillales bacterium]